MTVRLIIAADARVTSVQPLCDRLLSLSSQHDFVVQFKVAVFQLLSEIRFPAYASVSKLLCRYSPVANSDNLLKLVSVESRGPCRP
jgi:hypothetical protein